MKKYNRAQEKRNDLISVINYTILKEDGKAAKKHIGQESKRKPQGSTASGGIADYDREYDGKRRYKSGRSCQKNWRSKVQCKQDHAQKTSCELRFSGKNGRKHRSRRRAEGQKGQRVIEGALA